VCKIKNSGVFVKNTAKQFAARFVWKILHIYIVSKYKGIFCGVKKINFYKNIPCTTPVQGI